MMRAEFFAYGLRLVHPDRSRVDATGQMRVSLHNPRGLYVIAAAVPRAGGEGQRCGVSGEEAIQLVCRFPNPGSFAVNLFVSPQEYRTYLGVGSVAVNAR